MAGRTLLERKFVIDGQELLVEIYPTAINIMKIENKKTITKKIGIHARKDCFRIIPYKGKIEIREGKASGKELFLINKWLEHVYISTLHSQDGCRLK